MKKFAWPEMLYLIIEMEQVLERNYPGLSKHAKLKRFVADDQGKDHDVNFLMDKVEDDARLRETKAPWLPPDFNWFIQRAWTKPGLLHELHLHHRLEVLKKLVTKDERCLPALWSLSYPNKGKSVEIRIHSDLSGKCWHEPLKIPIADNLFTRYPNFFQLGISVLSVASTAIPILVAGAAVTQVLAKSKSALDQAITAKSILDRADLGPGKEKSSNELGMGVTERTAFLLDLLAKHNSQLDEYTIGEACYLHRAITKDGCYVWVSQEELDKLENHLETCKPEPNVLIIPSRAPSTVPTISLSIIDATGTWDVSFFTMMYCEWKLLHGLKNPDVINGEVTENAASTSAGTTWGSKLDLNSVDSIEMLRDCTLKTRSELSEIMAQKISKQSNVVPDNCFRLLRLKDEIQTDVKVLKAVVDEVDVLRLCRSLGMIISDEGNKKAMHNFEFGMFNSGNYDTDFARFIREKLVAGNAFSTRDVDQDSDDLLKIGCLFGKQLEDQGVYCIDGSGDRHQLVIFAWLDSNLFEPEAIRNTSAYVLRFLITLSSNITCCLSPGDFQRVKNEVDTTPDTSSMRWNSCSVAFRVQKQVEQKDNISSGAVMRVLIPNFDRAKSAWFVGGVVPAVAVENLAPSTTELVQRYETVPCECFAEWLMMKHDNFLIELPSKLLKPGDSRDNVLKKFGQFPHEELDALRNKADMQAEEAKQRINREVFDYAKGIYDDAVHNAGILFAVRHPTNSSQLDSALRRYEKLLQQWDQCGMLKTMDYNAYKMLYLPERIQTHMQLLYNTFQSNPSILTEVLDTIMRDDPVNTEENSRIGRWLGAIQGAIGRFWYSNAQFSKNFVLAMGNHQPRLQQIWTSAVEKIVYLTQAATWEQRVLQSTKDRQIQFGIDAEAVLKRAFDRLREHLKSGDDHLSIKILKLMRTSDGVAVNIKWNEEVEKEPTKVVRLYQLGSSDHTKMSLMGRIEFEPGFKLLKLATVKMGQFIAILVKESSTIVRRIQFSPQSKRKAEQWEVRTFPRACSLCSIRANDRRVAFLFGVSETSLGTVAFCRFNESFTSVEATQSIDMNASFGLANSLVDILLTERSLCIVDGNGHIQSFDVRTRRTSKKVSCGDDEIDDNSIWVGGLLSLADELVVGRAKLDKNKHLCVSSISNEDHRALPTVAIRMDLSWTDFTVGSIGDVVYVVNKNEGAIYSSKLSVAVRSDSYRIQRSGNGAKKSQTCLQADLKGPSTATQHWLRVFYHVFEKFPVRSLIDMSMNPDASFSFALGVAVVGCIDEKDDFMMVDATSVCQQYFNNIMVDLRRLNKPLSGLNLVKNLKYRCSKDHTALQHTSVGRVLMAIISFIPIQVCRAEENMLKLLQDGEDVTRVSKAANPTSSSDEGDSAGTDASEIAQSIRFGLLSPLLDSWNGRCVVVTSMGKQSTGKSYFLNHLAGTSFAISGSRCTDGAWMSLRFVSAEVLLVVLDFEGLGSFERSEQEDIFLSVLNASVSMFTVFRMESRFDKDIDGLFSRFQKGVQLIKNDPRLFRGLLYMSVKDVNMNDRQGVIDELVAKLDAIFEANRDKNFLTEMYAGQLEINCSPPFGTLDYYSCMENDAARALYYIISSTEEEPSGFVTGKAFLDCLRIVLAKISILDWTSMDKSTQNLIVADTKQKLPGILRTGCHISLPLVAEKVIPSHLMENVLQVGSHEKLVISLKEMCEANPGFMTKWMALNDILSLDSVYDEKFDCGFDVTTLTNKKIKMVQKTINMLFQIFLTLRGKTFESSRLTTEDQSDFDAFVAFVLRRRKMKVLRWLHGSLGENLSEVRTQLEQRHVDPLLVYFSRCQHRCAKCQLGCMRSMAHSPEIDEHNCSTDHKCRGKCEYGECQGNSEIPPCSRSAGHEGKCECEKGEHTCGQTCELAHASNCDKTCSKRAEHSGDHCCSVQVHVCGAKCSATSCTATCLLDIQREHSVHKCADVQCLHPCLMEGCKNVCGELNHFHGQNAESRKFAEESGIACNDDFSEDDEYNDPVTHMCTGSHACGEMCTIDGICEQKVHLKKSARTYVGARGSFEYVYQEMNGCKKHCAHVLPSGEVDHEGVGHSCLAQSSGEGDEQNTVHYCDARCPSCNYYCSKHFGHIGLHTTSHGNMRQTYFMAKGNDINVEDRKYQVGERGIAEMCNLFCAKMGRGHVHFYPCESKGDENCVYRSDGSKDLRRHCVDELFPPPDKDMDELLHSQFWTTIGWEDPCGEEERAVFSKCNFQCNSPEHDGADKEPSYCVLNAWHQPELKPEGADDGFAYVNGHKFKCLHTADTGKFHIIFVLDNSGSMSGQPWQYLLSACSDFGISRLNDGGENDLASFVTFDDRSRIFCEGEPLAEALQMSVPYSGGGTSYGQGLRAANEVLSRNDFEEFKVALVFFSDGQPWDIDLGITLAQHIRSNYAMYDLKAFVVGFGRVVSSVLQRVATELGGEYRQVLDANALRTEFQRIAAVLCNSEASLALLESSEKLP